MQSIYIIRNWHRYNAINEMKTTYQFKLSITIYIKPHSIRPVSPLSLTIDLLFHLWRASNRHSGHVLLLLSHISMQFFVEEVDARQFCYLCLILRTHLVHTNHTIYRVMIQRKYNRRHRHERRLWCRVATTLNHVVDL